MNDDIVLYSNESRSTPVLTWYGLRQQTPKQVIEGQQMPSRCLADFVAPKNATYSGAGHAGTAGSGIQNDMEILDYCGMFAVTTGIGVEQRAKAFEAAHDDYSAILLKALADRLAEAFAELLHRKVRTDLWGYAAQENLEPAALIAERYQGIRPAPGYPACPDHSVKQAMFAVLQCDDIGMGITESLAMTPAASVCGFYIGHPDSCYFNVGKIGDDQVTDSAQRQGKTVRELQRRLAPNL